MSVFVLQVYIILGLDMKPLHSFGFVSAVEHVILYVLLVRYVTISATAVKCYCRSCRQRKCGLETF